MENKYKKKYISERVFLYINQEFLIYFMTLMGHLAVGTLLSKYIRVIFSMVNCLPNTCKCSAEMRK